MTTCEEDLFCGINKPKDPNNLSDLEKKHTPVITPGEVTPGTPTEVTVEVGKLLKHPNEHGHFIEWIELYSGDTFLGRYDLTPELSEPKITARINLKHSHKLRAVIHCNLHGAWASQ